MFGAGSCFSAEERVVAGVTEGASHFTRCEGVVYQANIGPAMDRVFNAYFTIFYRRGCDYQTGLKSSLHSMHKRNLHKNSHMIK